MLSGFVNSSWEERVDGIENDGYLYEEGKGKGGRVNWPT